LIYKLLQGLLSIDGRKSIAYMNNGSVSPAFDKVYKGLETKILEGELKYGERLQTEKWLCDYYKASRTTVRKAIDALINKGLLERKPNKGVYVLYTKFDTRFQKPASIFQELTRSGVKTTSKIISYRILWDENKFMEIFDCGPLDNIIEISRLRYADDDVFSIQTIYLLEEVFPDFNPWGLVGNPTQDILSTGYNIEIGSTVQVVNVASSSKRQSVLLNIPQKTPLLFTKSTMYTKDKRVIEYQETYVNTNKIPYSYRVNMG